MRLDQIDGGVPREQDIEFLRAHGAKYEPDQVIYREVGGKLVGMWAYTGYAGDSIQMHLVCEPHRGLNRALLWKAFEYPFEQLGVTVVIGVLPGHNVAALKLASKLGFTSIGRIAELDLVLMTMSRAQCRWLELSSKRFYG